jgi:cardiolipin synthase A/B
MNKFETITEKVLTYNEIFKQLTHAKISINISTFKLGSDKVGKKLINILVKKSKEIPVNLIVDHFGLRTMTKEDREKIFSSKINLTIFNPIFPLYFKYLSRYKQFKIDSRNHQKLTLIDRKIAYVGGVNFAEEENEWRDLVVKIEGNIVKDLLDAFIETHSISHKKLFMRRKNKLNLKLNKEFDGKNDLVLRQIPFTKTKQIRTEIIKSTYHSKKEINIVTPYFVPDIKLLRNLFKKLRAGIKINLIIPKKSDSKILDIINRFFAIRLLKRGAKVFLYEGMIHSKYIIIDSKLCSFGSANFDYRSLHLNYELNILSKNKNLIQQLNNIFTEDLTNSKEMSYKKWYKRSWKIKFLEKLLLPFKKNF